MILLKDTYLFKNEIIFDGSDSDSEPDPLKTWYYCKSAGNDGKEWQR